MLKNINKIISVTKICLLAIVISNLCLLGCSKHHNMARNILGRGDYSANKPVDPYIFYGENISPEREKDLLSENVVYFGYDQDEISNRYQLVLLAHAKKLLETPHLKLRVDGHTDERGSSEYNIGLGERRAKAVIRFIEAKGVRSERLVSVSYGKEKPAATGHTEEAWRLNRRAELVYE